MSKVLVLDLMVKDLGLVLMLVDTGLCLVLMWAGKGLLLLWCRFIWPLVLYCWLVRTFSCLGCCGFWSRFVVSWQGSCFGVG